MLKNYRKINFIAVLIFSALLVGVCLFLDFNKITSAATPSITFTADTILDLNGLNKTVYIASGSGCDSLSVSDTGSTVVIPAGNTFGLKTTVHKIFEITPVGAVNFAFSSNNFANDSISQWTENGSSSVSHIIRVPFLNLSYYIKVNGSDITGSPFAPDSNGRITFTRTGAGKLETYTVSWAPAFPAAGSSTTWTCAGSGTPHTDATCTATRAAAPVTGTCGTAATSYAYNATAFSGTMCGLGNGVTTPATVTFPAQGSSVTWTCGGSNGGGSSPTCTATRAANSPPIASGLKVDSSTYCLSTPVSSFSWTYTDAENNPQTKYELQISTNSGFTNLVYDYCTSSGCPSSTTSVSLLVSTISTSSCAPNCTYISYNTSYYWRVRVWDASTGANPAWSAYTNASSTPVNTYKYPYSHPPPSPSYSIAPTGTIYINQQVNFSDDGSICHGYTAPNITDYLCRTSSVTGYSWWFNWVNDDTPADDTTNKITTSHTYTVGAEHGKIYTTQLQICDEISCCQVSEDIIVLSTHPVPVPEWKEISPF